MVVDDVSVKIEPKQFVAIVGRSGSGKSTVANLILGLYKPLGGRILFDGHDMNEVDLRALRQQLGIVNQKLSLFGATIRDNIALSDPTLSLEDVAAAAKLACVHDDIVAMPLGYSTPLVDGGGSISGGQKQRLALARALVRRPAILLLDEATSALDALTEAQVQKSLDELQCTRIVIAHRLSTIRRADVILVVEKGQVIESGDHESLVANGGFYAQLVATQMGGQQDHAEGHDEGQGARSGGPTPSLEKPAPARNSSRRPALPPPDPMAAVSGGHAAPKPSLGERMSRGTGPPSAGRAGSVLSSAQRAKLTGFRPPKS
jgi:ABC-type multidrug transport system fused ATPase/permease subunit